MLCEIGGTVGDIEAMPFFEAIRQLGNDLPRGNAVYVHLTLMPYIPAAGELKTKPTQHSVKELRSIGIQPDILLVPRRPRRSRRTSAGSCRCSATCAKVGRDPGARRRRTSTTCRSPITRKGSTRGARRLRHRPGAEAAHGAAGKRSRDRIHNPEGEVTIAIVGKYTGLKDAYKSLIEALSHGGIANRVKVKLDWIESEIFEKEDPAPYLEKVHGILVPGGFGERGSEGKIQAARIRPRAQGAVFRHLLRHADGLHRGGAQPGRRRERLLDRIRPDRGAGRRPDDRMAEGQRCWRSAPRDRRSRRHDAARRLSGAPGAGQPKIAEIYGDTQISERHRHRYEVNIDYKERLEECGLVFAGMSPDGVLPETIEYPDHPWFIGVQYHPELKIRPLRPASAVRELHRRGGRAEPAGLSRAAVRLCRGRLRAERIGRNFDGCLCLRRDETAAGCGRQRDPAANRRANSAEAVRLGCSSSCQLPAQAPRQSTRMTRPPLPWATPLSTS